MRSAEPADSSSAPLILSAILLRSDTLDFRRIRPGATLSGNIASAHEKDYYCLSATGGQTYEIGVDLASLGDSVLEVYSPDGVTKIAEDDDGGSGTASYLVWTAPGTGQYRLAVRGYGSDTGTYTISVQDSAAADPCNGSGGASLSGSGDIFFSDQYENSASCQWTLSCSSGHPHIHFSQFETERNFDFVNVYDGSSSGSSRLAHLSGPSADQQDFTGSSRSMVVEFTADGSVTAGGFELHYSCGAHRRMGTMHPAKVVQPSVYAHEKKRKDLMELTDEEIISRFSSLHALLTALSTPSPDGRNQEYKGVPHNIWLLFINTLVRKAASTPEGAALLATFQEEQAETARVAKAFADAMIGNSAGR